MAAREQLTRQRPTKEQPIKEQPTRERPKGTDLKGSNLEKDPDEWKTGDEPMTGAQASYLKTLSDQAGVPFDPGLTKAEASRQIDRLQAQTGRGRR